MEQVVIGVDPHKLSATIEVLSKPPGPLAPYVVSFRLPTTGEMTRVADVLTGVFSRVAK